jgi:hypothetical protein
VIYVIQAEIGGPIKIGYTSGAAVARLADLQCGSPLRLRIVGTFKGDIGRERRIHGDLAEHRLHGEWFSVNETVMSYLRAATTEEIMPSGARLESYLGPRLSATPHWHGPLTRIYQVIFDAVDDMWRGATEIEKRAGVVRGAASPRLDALRRRGWPIDQGCRPHVRAGYVWRRTDDQGARS